MIQSLSCRLCLQQSSQTDTNRSSIVKTITPKRRRGKATTMSPTSSYRSVVDYESIEDLTRALQTVSVDSKEVQQNSADWLLSVYDREGSVEQSVEHEVKRLQALKSYQILDSECEEMFDQFTAEVREHFNVPLAVLSFVDLGRVWIKSTDGGKFDVVEAARRDANCAHTVLLKEGLLVVPDALEDFRFRENVAAAGAAGLRFYAGVPLISPDGYKIGALCVVDRNPRPEGVSKQEELFLKAKAEAAVKALVVRKNRLESEMKRDRSLSDSPSLSRIIKRVCSDHSFDVHGQHETIQPPLLPRSIPDPKSCDSDPDQYLSDLLQSLYGVAPKITPALKLQGFFAEISEDQVAAYSMDVVCAARENNADKLRSFLEERGRECLACHNQFGEGLLNLACRRGFKDIVKLLLSSEVQLPVRVRDDYGRTPLHDACWHPEAQLDIVAWILQEDPTLFLIADKRGFTPFQYARKGDWPIWRQFLFDNRDQLKALVQPEMLQKFL